MPLIITATNFSDVAGNAINYACSLATNFMAEVVILHSFIIPVTFSDIPLPGSVINDTQEEAEEFLAGEVNRFKEIYPEINIKGKIIYGSTVDAIDELIEECGEPWMIVVGNSTTEQNHTWLDSTVLDAMKNSDYPILTIPPGFRYNTLKRICFAFDNNHKGIENALKQIANLTTTLNAELHVLNVQKDTHNQDNIPDFNGGARIILDEVNAHYHMIFDAGNVDKAIDDFTNNNKFDLLIIIPRKYGFFENLIHKSHTNNIAHFTHIPVMALHELKN